MWPCCLEGLADTSHLLEIIATGTTSATDTKVTVDAFIVTAADSSTTTIEEDHPAVTLTDHFDSIWSIEADPSASGGGYAMTTESDGVMTYSFTGTGVQWLAIQRNEGFLVDVYMEGSFQQTVDLNTGSSPGSGGNGSTTGPTEYQQLVWSQTNLIPGQHLLKLVVAPGQSSQGLCNDCGGAYRGCH